MAATYVTQYNPTVDLTTINEPTQGITGITGIQRIADNLVHKLSFFDDKNSYPNSVDGKVSTSDMLAGTGYAGLSGSTANVFGEDIMIKQNLLFIKRHHMIGIEMVKQLFGRQQESIILVLLVLGSLLQVNFQLKHQIFLL